MHEQWNRLEQSLSALGCLDQMRLRPGASDEKIAELELHLGVRLPDGVITFGRDEDTKRVIANSFEHFVFLLISAVATARWNGEYLDLAI